MFRQIISINVIFLLSITAHKDLMQSQATDYNYCSNKELCTVNNIQGKVLDMKQDLREKLESHIALLQNNIDENKAKLLQKFQEIAITLSEQGEELLQHIKAALAPPANCEEWLQKKNYGNGVYKISPSGDLNNTMDVYCLIRKASDGTASGWAVIQRRQDGTVNFNRNWKDYQDGFGDLNGEYFLGLDKIHEITSSAPHSLWIELMNFEGEVLYAQFDNFLIGNSAEDYQLHSLGRYTGNARDALSYHLGMKFTTFDVNNSEGFQNNCAALFKGGWWYNACHHCNLNGFYYKSYMEKDDGIVWLSHNGWRYSHKYVHMALRRNE